MIYGTAIFSGAAFGEGSGGSGSGAALFGTGADGILTVMNEQVVELPVPVPYQSIIEMNYESIDIQAGGILKAAANNAGMIIRCKGDCNISGTIDQSGKSPKPNPNNVFDYPVELLPGKGGNGGSTSYHNASAAGGLGMPYMKYGGGWSGGGAGGCTGSRDSRDEDSNPQWTYSGASGGAGGSANTITVLTEDSSLFIGGAAGAVGRDTTIPACGSGSNGGGGGSCGFYIRHYTSTGDRYIYAGTGGAGATGAGLNGGAGGLSQSTSGKMHLQSSPGGGAGNIGGGIVLLYVGGNLTIDGSILCNGLNGGGDSPPQSGYSLRGSRGGAGGGAGGGAIYIVHGGTYTNLGSLSVNGGLAGATGSPGEAGALGSITVKKYVKGMTK